MLRDSGDSGLQRCYRQADCSKYVLQQPSALKALPLTADGDHIIESLLAPL